MHSRKQMRAHTYAHTQCLGAHQTQSSVVSPPQDESRKLQQDTGPLQVEYYPPNGTFSLHYFPYYGKKAQVGFASLRPSPVTTSLKFNKSKAPSIFLQN
jgi:hypothetical protein